MIKKIETVRDVAIVDTYCPGVADIPIITDGSKDEYGCLIEGLITDPRIEDYIIGTFYDTDANKVFRLEAIYDSHNDLTFVMTQFYNKGDRAWLRDDVVGWHYGEPDGSEADNIRL